MIRINRIVAENSEEELFYVYDEVGKLLLDGADKLVFEEWSEFVGVELPKEFVLHRIGEIQITVFESDREIEIEEYMDANKLFKNVKPILTYVTNSERNPNMRVLGFVKVGEHKTTMYKPAKESQYFDHPRKYMNKEAYDKLPQIYLFM